MIFPAFVFFLRDLNQGNSFLGLKKTDFVLIRLTGKDDLLYLFDKMGLIHLFQYQYQYISCF